MASSVLVNSSLEPAARQAKLVAACRSGLEEHGVFEMPSEAGLLSEQEWVDLEALTEEGRLSYHDIQVGDAREDNRVRVGRFMVDKDWPTPINLNVASEAMRILANPRLMSFFSELLQEEPLHLRRAQVNLMSRGSYIGRHLDTDSNPDYRIAVVLHFCDGFEGGEFVVHGQRAQTVVMPGRRSVVVSNCAVEHEVRVVHSGVRKSCVFFLSGYAGKNRRAPETYPEDSDTELSVRKDLKLGDAL